MALKKFHEDDEEPVKDGITPSGLRELMALHRIQQFCSSRGSESVARTHPNVIQLLGHVVDDECSCFAFELLSMDMTKFLEKCNL